MKHLAFLLLLAACGAKAPPPSSAPTAGSAEAPPAAGSAEAPPAAGSADHGCICPMIYEPVCGADGKTYSNECNASCAKVAVKAKGACS